MRKQAKNHRKTWSKEDLDLLKKLVKGNTPTGLIAHKTGRSESSVRSKAFDEGISLKPTNRSPYDRKVSNSKRK